VLGTLLGAATAHGREFDARLKAFGTANMLPDEDIQREFSGSPAYDANLDLRLMFREDLGAWRLIVDHSSLFVTGDTYEFGVTGRGGSVDQTPTDDARRFFDLTWTLDKGSDYRLYHRFDRLALQYRADSWGVTIGREAVSWGSGKIFQPMDLFAPFAPTTVDRDYKAGEDLIIVDKLFAGGSDLQLLAIFRRDEDENRELDEGSYGGKWRAFLGASELELAAGSHYEDSVAGASFRFPIGGALVQTDWIGTYLDAEDEWKVSGVVNIDYSFSAWQKTAYVFAEYYRNGFGENRSPIDLGALPDYLVDRLARGEVFNFMKDYLGFGGSYQWHPLIVQSATVLVNLHDNSSLLQTNVTYEPSDHQRLEAGLTVTGGDRGDEYGRIAVLENFTTGGGSRVFLRWVYFW
jgi:hypothetical protein